MSDKATSEERLTVWISQQRVKQIWRRSRRNHLIHVTFLSNQSTGENVLARQSTTTYSIPVYITTRARTRVRQPDGKRGYDYRYDGVTAWKSTCRIIFSDDGFDPRRYIFFTPPSTEMDWARSFS